MTSPAAKAWSTVRMYANNVGIIAGFAALMLLGYCVPARQFLESIGGSSLGDTLFALLAVICTWTPTNLLLSTIFACYIAIMLANRQRGETADIADVWTDATLRGIVVWFTALGGAAWLDWQKVYEATNESYVRLWVAVVGAGLALSLPPKETVARLLRVGDGHS